LCTPDPKGPRGAGNDVCQEATSEVPLSSEKKDDAMAQTISVSGYGVTSLG